MPHEALMANAKLQSDAENYLASHSIIVPHNQVLSATTTLGPNVFTVTPISDQHQFAAKSVSSANRGTFHTTNHTFQSHLIKRGQHMTRICMILCISFLVQGSPWVILQSMIAMNLVDVTNETVDILFNFVVLLGMSNHCMNFWAYCVCWKEFRERAIKLFKTLCCTCKACVEAR